MLHRMTMSLSTVVVGFVAIVVLIALLPAAARAADNCLAKPTGTAPNGSHWYYQPNRVTHEKCWHLGAQVSKADEDIPARPRESGKRAAALSRKTADAEARYVDPALAAPGAPETVSSLEQVAEWSAIEDRPLSNFASRWTDLPGVMLPGDGQPARYAEIDQPVAAVADEGANSGNGIGPLFKARQPLDITVMVFLVSLAGALGLFGLLGRAFLYERSGSERIDEDPFDVAGLDDAPSPRPPIPDGPLAPDALLMFAGRSRSEPDSSRSPAGGDQRLPNPFSRLGEVSYSRMVSG